MAGAEFRVALTKLPLLSLAFKINIDERGLGRLDAAWAAAGQRSLLY